MSSENTPTELHAPDGPRWAIEGYHPDSPFTATLVFTDAGVTVEAHLTPDLLNQMCPALDNIRAAQRAVVLGEPAPQPSGHTATAPDATNDADQPATPPKGKRGKVFLIVLASIVAAAMLYSVIAGAILI